MERINPRARRDAFGSKINRDHSSLLANGIPWASIMLGSLSPLLPIIAQTPVIPPLGLLMLLAWRFFRPGLLPLWAGLPLGLFDDFFSGQPIGSGIVLFTLALIAIELLEYRFPWRSFLYDWFNAAMLTLAYIAIATVLSGARLTGIQAMVMLPQLIFAIMLFPVLARVVALLDRLRLMRVRRIA